MLDPLGNFLNFDNFFFSCGNLEMPLPSKNFYFYFFYFFILPFMVKTIRSLVMNSKKIFFPFFQKNGGTSQDCPN